MNMYDPEQEMNQTDERIIDAALRTYPVQPLPTGFTERVMQSIALESPAQPIVRSPYGKFSLKQLLQARHNLFEEVIAVGKQLRTGDFLIATFFALLWFTVVGTLIWSTQLVASNVLAASNSLLASWFISLCIALGSCIMLGLLGVVLYHEQVEN
ncbi:MAG: hypothetical protein AAF702_30980 [Chloroflexota bacterium]